MENILDLIPLLLFLLPGFVTAAIFYNLTSYPKLSQFERVIQALIFTLFIKAAVIITGYLSIKAGKFGSIEEWNKDALSFISSIAIAVILGLVLSYLANNDTIHKRLRCIGITKETSFPSEWFSSFLKPTFVILHFNDGSRLYGWPAEWPSEPTKGHFSIADPSWINKEGKEERITGVSNILIDVEDIKWVEFLEEPKEGQDG